LITIIRQNQYSPVNREYSLLRKAFTCPQFLDWPSLAARLPFTGFNTEDSANIADPGRLAIPKPMIAKSARYEALTKRFT